MLQLWPHFLHFISMTVGPSFTNEPSGFLIRLFTVFIPQTGHFTVIVGRLASIALIVSDSQLIYSPLFHLR